MERRAIIESGLLELYAMGALEGTELLLVNETLSVDPLLAKELVLIEETLFRLAYAIAIVPHPAVKLLLMAKVTYMERLKNGEVPAQVPLLNAASRIADFQPWLDREDMQLPSEFNEGHVVIISQEPDKMTAIVWLQLGSPPEIHTTEYERFLIVEGSCDLTIGTEVHHLESGDYLSIPLHISHDVRVTSLIPCKIILQRIAA